MKTQISHPQGYKYLIYFVVAFLACYLTEIVLINRFISLGGGFYITGGTFIYFCSPLIIDVVTEVYGYRVARQILWCGFAAMLFMALCIFGLTFLPYPKFWAHVVNDFHSAMSSIPRVAVVSVVTILIGQIINIYCMSKWKILTRGRYFWMRSVGSSIIGDTITIILSIILIFSGRVSMHHILLNIAPELIIMLIFSAIGAIPAAFLAKVIARKEGIEHYDVNVNFNPFKLDPEA